MNLTTGADWGSLDLLDIKEVDIRQKQEPWFSETIQ